MTKHEDLRLSDRELAMVQQYANEQGLTLDEAASKLISLAIEKKFRRSVNRGPAKVYSLPRKTS